jgi:hypothetical protein
MTANLGSVIKSAAAAPNAMRVGRVVAIGLGLVDVTVAGRLLVDIPVLGSYRPVLGDLVAMIRQNAAWLVVGSTAGVTGSTWINFTPAWTNTTTQPSIGNGNWTGSRWRTVTDASGEAALIFFEIVLNWGSTTSGGTGSFWTFGFPVTPSAHSALHAIGEAALFDSNVIGRQMWMWQTFNSNILPLSVAGVLANQASPWTWATGDFIKMRGWFEPLVSP